jgi:hypothetical protein
MVSHPQKPASTWANWVASLYRWVMSTRSVLFIIKINLPPGLFWLAFTTYPHVHWIAPIIASIPFGAGVYFVFTSVFTYLVTAYRPIAASAMASNSAMRSTFAAAFPLFAGAMYHRLGTVGATALLAGLTLMMAPLPWVAILPLRCFVEHSNRSSTDSSSIG